jgi:hypothetical protein
VYTRYLGTKEFKLVFETYRLLSAEKIHGGFFQLRRETDFFAFERTGRVRLMFFRERFEEPVGVR